VISAAWTSRGRRLLTGYMNSYSGGFICQLPVLAVRGLTWQTTQQAEKSTHPLDFHDHDGDGFDRAVGVVKSAEVAIMEVDVCIVVCMELSEVKPACLGPT
jgi:hypothetical protein